MTTLARPVHSLAAVLTISAVVLLGCSSSPAAGPTPAPSTASPAPSAPTGSDGPSTDASSTGPASTGPAVTDTPAPSGTGAGSSAPAAGDPATSAPADTVGGGTTGGPARIEISGAICPLLEKKIPVAEMVTLTGLAVDRTVEMGDAWCIYTSGGPDDVVTVQYSKDAKSSFDLLGADGTPVDTTTLGVPMYADQDLNGVYFLDGTTQWEVRVGNAGNGADPAQYAAAITVAQKLLG